MINKMFRAAMIACIGILSACNIGLCPSGEQDCGDGTCTQIGRVCCGDGTSCPGGYVCGVGECLGGGIVSGPINTVEGCIAQGEQPCENSDGVIDCAPLSASCCGNHTNCSSGYCCSAGCCH